MLLSTTKSLSLLLQIEEEVPFTVQILPKLLMLQFFMLMPIAWKRLPMLLKLQLNTDKSSIMILLLISLATGRWVTTSSTNLVSHNHLCIGKLQR